MASNAIPMAHLAHLQKTGTETLPSDFTVPDKYKDHLSLSKVFDVISTSCSCRVQCTQLFSTIEIKYPSPENWIVIPESLSLHWIIILIYFYYLDSSFCSALITRTRCPGRIGFYSSSRPLSIPQSLSFGISFLAEKFALLDFRPSMRSLGLVSTLFGLW